MLLSVIVALFHSSQASSSDAFRGGVWTKTTHPDNENIAIFHVDGQAVKAIGYGRISGRPAVWYAEGRFKDGYLKLSYRYSSDATPEGWDSEGVMQLKLSEDGNSMTGRASSKSGSWADRIEFRKLK
jgi:hypothetical protein